ncbi:HAD-IIB family hydrolase [Candidatus Kaiserbacteria bacterium]|nr:HAD-IIB family hydrolase [Candidatus Kaiserbacteria bacterium]
MQCPRAALFDLDDTLAESFRTPSPEVLDGLKKTLDLMPVAIMTGTGFQKIEERFLPVLAAHPRSDRLYIFPASSGQAYVQKNGVWEQVYDLALTEEERAHIKAVMTETVSALKELQDIPHYGEQIVDRGAQVAYTHVGVDAPTDVKASWDRDGSKRASLWSTLKNKLPEFEVLMGGVTTIDITRKGVNKSHGVKWLSEHLGIPIGEMLYVGDALYPGGNDAVVIPTGIETRSVSGPPETLQVIEEILAACSA